MEQRKTTRSARAAISQPNETSPALTAEARDQRLYDAVLAYQAGKYAEAEAEARRLSAAAPGFFPVVLLLGMIAGKTGRTAEGIGILRDAVALDRRSAEARNELAGLLRSTGSSVEAIVEAKHAVRLKPDDPGSHNNLGLCYLAAGRVPPAIAHFRRAIGIKPDAAMFHHNLGLALEQQSRDFEAMAAFRQALDLDSGNAEALARLGFLLFQHGQPGEAARCYERATAMQRDVTLAAVHEAEALIQQGQAAAAENCLRRALAADPQSDLGHQVLGVLLQRRGRFDEAIAVLERAIELQPKRVAAYLSLVLGKKIGAGDEGLIQGMLALVADGSLAAPDRSRLHFALGKAYDDLADYASAMSHFDQAHQLELDRMRRAGRSFDRKARKAWTDRSINGFTADFLARAPSVGVSSELPILIVGMPRSGTTLVEQILSSHPAIGAAGELTFWTDQPTAIESALKSTLPQAELHRLAEEYLALLRAVAPTSHRVTDKMPVNFLVLGLIHLALPAARIIHCRRHPVDTCLSIYATPFGNLLDFVHERADIVFFYEQYACLMAHWRSVIPPSRMLEIDYEPLVADPEGVTRKMIDFCGLDWDDACLRHERNDHIIMTPSVWQARQPVYRDAVERWRRYENWLGDFNRLLNAAS